MKYVVLAWFLASLASTATACDLLGVKGQISDDGQSITRRQPIALKEQAKQYGGYEAAANFIEQNRQAVMSSEKFSPSVKNQVNSDLTANVAQLKCWAKVCSKNSADPICIL